MYITKKKLEELNLMENKGEDKKPFSEYNAGGKGHTQNAQ